MLFDEDPERQQEAYQELMQHSLFFHLLAHKSYSSFKRLLYVVFVLVVVLGTMQVLAINDAMLIASNITVFLILLTTIGSL